MARCDICGFEQFPADIITYYERDGSRHFFCTKEHLEQWKAGDRPSFDINVGVEGIEPPPAMEPEPVKAPVKRKPRQSKSK